MAAAFTALAGNPPVNGADEDGILALGGTLAGLAVAGIAWAFEHSAAPDGTTVKA